MLILVSGPERIIPSTSTKLEVGYTDFILSICLSVDKIVSGQALGVFYYMSEIHWIPTLLTLSVYFPFVIQSHHCRSGHAWSLIIDPLTAGTPTHKIGAMFKALKPTCWHMADNCNLQKHIFPIFFLWWHPSIHLLTESCLLQVFFLIPKFWLLGFWCACVQARITKFGPEVQNNLVKILLFWGLIDLDLQGQIESKIILLLSVWTCMLQDVVSEVEVKYRLHQCLCHLKQPMDAIVVVRTHLLSSLLAATFRWLSLSPCTVINPILLTRWLSARLQ